MVRINTTANQLIDNTKQGSPASLQENLKRLNADWNRLKTKVAQRQHDFKQTQLELEQFQITMQRDYKLLTDVDRVVERGYHMVGGTESELEEALRVRNLQTVLFSNDSLLPLDVATQCNSNGNQPLARST